MDIKGEVVQQEFIHQSLLFETWTFNETCFGVSIVILLYLSIVLWILPRFMKHRQPYKLTNILLSYNIFQVAFSGYAVFLYAKYMFHYGILPTRCPKGIDLRKVVSDIWPYFIAKHVDLLDTVFFVLRKKDRQVTFLHVFHHALMITWAWFYLMYYPTDHFVAVGFANSFVHVLMYAYYGISSLGPEYSKFIWWKKHLTKIQLIQFILVIMDLHYQQKLSPCPIPSTFHYFCISCICSFFLLFLHFYVQNYSAIQKKKMDTINVGCNVDMQKMN